MLLEIRDGSVSRGGNPILSHFSFAIHGREKIAIVGRNGAGKTTLLEVLAGSRDLDHNDKNHDSGIYRSRAFTVGMLQQIDLNDPDKTVEQNILETVMQSLPNDAVYDKERFDYEQRYDRMFTDFGFLKEDKHKLMKDFSGGEKKKIQLIELLLSQPDLLILDEPTNHLDMDSVTWLESYIKSYPKAVVMVTHDRYFMNRTADVIWEVESGKCTRYPGNYSQYKQLKTTKYNAQLKAYEAQQAEIKRQEDLIRKFKHKPKKASFARSRVKMLERMERIEKPVKDGSAMKVADIIPNHLGSKWVYQCEELGIGYDDRLLRKIDFRLRRGQKIGIIGPNGSGKTTFMKTLAGILPKLSGKMTQGNHIEVAYFDQLSSNIDSDKSVIDWFHDQYPALTDKELRSILAGYLFHGADCAKQVSALSGGEKARLQLAAILQARPNLLLLDEPTNHMDIPAKEAMEAIFKAYQGTILVISHDRYFLDRVARSLMVFPKDDGEVKYYPFGYSHYMEQMEALESGQDLAALRSAAEQKMVDELKAVPKGERHRLREISTRQASLDWDYSLNREKMAQALEQVEELEESRQEASSGYMSLEEYMAGGSEPALETEDSQKVSQDWTDACLDWYDLWLEDNE